MSNVDTGDWFYSGSPLQSDKDEIRFLVGDTQSDRQLLSDQEIQAAITLALRAGSPGGTLSTPTLYANGTFSAGLQAIDLDAPVAYGTILVGDSFVVAGNSTRYYVTAEAEIEDNAVTELAFRPGLQATVADDTAIVFRLFGVHEAAALCCDNLARRFATEVDVSVDGRSEAFSQRYRAFMSLATELRQQAGRGSLGLLKLYRT
jgi:hypothetical protein